MSVLCAKPLRRGVMEFGCGQCMPCRVNRRRVWTARLLLESRCHDECCFLTLTYSSDKVPVDESLDPGHHQLFLKRLRRKLEPAKISYYLVGEYGSRTDRPHYHVVLFGFAPEDRGHLVAGKKDQLNYYGPKSRLLLDAWGNGDIDVGCVEEKSIMYALKHLTKGLKNGQMRIDGKYPEFARMSLNPAIGRRAMESFADVLTSEEGCFQISRDMDVPLAFRSSQHLMGFGRYLKNILRIQTGGETQVKRSWDKKRKKWNLRVEAVWNEISRMEAMVRMVERYERLTPYGIDDLRRGDLAKARLSKTTQETRL